MPRMQNNILPDYHFLLFAPNLDSAYFFEAARNYWNTFQPTVLTDLELLRLLPVNVTISVTAVALRDTAAQVGVEVSQASPFAFLDLVVYDTLEQTQAELDRRAAQNQPFGVPLGIGSATQAVIPTPWLPTRSPAFVTATPSPTDGPSPTPTSTPQVPPTQPGAVQNTPGPVIGG
jgi:hypothetical protein